MKIIIIFIDLLMATVLFFVGRFFIKSRNTERSVLFLSGDYTGLNTEKICRVKAVSQRRPERPMIQRSS